MITETQMLEILADCAPGSEIFVSYIAGREPSERAYVEAHRALTIDGISARHFTGTLEAVRDTKKGEKVLVLWVNERDTVGPTGAVQQGNWRAFNPNLGKMLSLEVISTMPKGAIAL